MKSNVEDVVQARDTTIITLNTKVSEAATTIITLNKKLSEAVEAADDQDG